MRKNTERGGFELSAPLIYQILLEKCYSRKAIVTPFLTDDVFASMASLVEYLASNIETRNVIEVTQGSKNRTTNFPSEYIFQAEFFSVLRENFRLLPPALNAHPWTVLVEAKAMGSSSRADILIQDGIRILLELTVMKGIHLHRLPFLTCKTWVIKQFLRNVLNKLKRMERASVVTKWF